MIVGFTGTRKGMNRRQFRIFRKELKELTRNNAHLHHGDCLGADVQAHRLALELGIPITIHPPLDTKHRAYCEDADMVLDTKDYIQRNHDIVDACDVLFVLPETNVEQLRSGTWATCRYARTIESIKIIIIKRS